jgi:hypothetical protein
VVAVLDLFQGGIEPASDFLATGPDVLAQFAHTELAAAFRAGPEDWRPASAKVLAGAGDLCHHLAALLCRGEVARLLALLLQGHQAVELSEFQGWVVS